MTWLCHSTVLCLDNSTRLYRPISPVQSVFCKSRKGDVLTTTVAHLLCLLQVTELQEQLQARDKQMQGVMQQHTAHSSGLSQERQQLLDQASFPLDALPAWSKFLVVPRLWCLKHGISVFGHWCRQKVPLCDACKVL